MSAQRRLPRLRRGPVRCSAVLEGLITSVTTESDVRVDLTFSLSHESNDRLAMPLDRIVVHQTDRTYQVIEEVWDLQLIKRRVAIWINEAQT